VPLALRITASTVNEGTLLPELVEAIPAVRGKRGRPRRRPRIVQGDRGYSSEPHRRWLREKRIRPLLAKIGTPHGSGLGRTRWVVERTIAWLHQFRRLRLRWERRADIHYAFLSLGASLITLRFLPQGF
jgi:transposase InsO family protein